MMFAFEIALMALMATTLVFAVRLERRLGQLRRDRGELERLARDLHDACTRTGESLQAVRVEAERAGLLLGEPLARAEAVRDELALLVGRGERAAAGVAEIGRLPREAGLAPRRPTRPVEAIGSASGESSSPASRSAVGSVAPSAIPSSGGPVRRTPAQESELARAIAALQ